MAYDIYEKWRDFVFGLARVQLQPSQLAGAEFCYDLLGVEHSSWMRPNDASSLTFLPGRLNPKSAIEINPEVRPAFKRMVEYHNAMHWTMPRLNSRNIIEFLHWYDAWFRIADIKYRKEIAGDL